MEVRRATLADQAELQAMACAFLETSDYGRVLERNEEAIADLIVNVLEHGIGFVLDLEGKAVGMLGLIAGDHLASRQRYAEEVVWFVDEAHRRGTAGVRLLRAAEEWARQNGCQYLKMVAPTRSSVGSFYERIGYEALETTYIKRLT